MSPATEIKAADVQKLRLTTGAGLMDCKKALVDTAGDIDKALNLLRERGIAKSSKRADKTAGEGVVTFWISDDQKEGILFELNSETDFVARNEEFLTLAQNVLKQIKENPSWTSVDQISDANIKALSGKVGEKIEPRRFGRLKSANGLVSGYIHLGSKLGVLLQLDSDKGIQGNDDVRDFAKEITLQIAAANPTYIHQKEIPADLILHEKEITKKQMEGQKKKPEILEKIAQGKLQQFYSLHCLLDQPHVRDSAGKTKISQLVQTISQKAGTNITIAKFVRFRVGAE